MRAILASIRIGVVGLVLVLSVASVGQHETWPVYKPTQISSRRDAKHLYLAAVRVLVASGETIKFMDSEALIISTEWRRISASFSVRWVVSIRHDGTLRVVSQSRGLDKRQRLQSGKMDYRDRQPKVRSSVGVSMAEKILQVAKRYQDASPKMRKETTPPERSKPPTKPDPPASSLIDIPE